MIDKHSKSGKGYKWINITPENINEYMNNIPSCFYKLNPAHQAVVVRVNVLYNYGGIWLDSDTIVIETLDNLFELLETNDAFFIKENNKDICNALFGSKPQSNIMKRWCNKIMEILNKKHEHIQWNDIDSNIINHLVRTNKTNKFHIFNGLDTMYPVNWCHCVNTYLYQNNPTTLIRQIQPLIILTNSVYKEVEKESFDEIINTDRALKHFLEKSINNLNLNTNDVVSSLMSCDSVTHIN